MSRPRAIFARGLDIKDTNFLVSVGILVQVGAVFPQPFKVVKVAHFVVEDMNDYVGVVNNVPPALSAAVFARGNLSEVLFHLFFKVVAERPYRRRRPCPRDYKIIAKA